MKDLNQILKLEDLWRLVDEVNSQHFPDNSLKPIVGGGQEKSPRFMFVFINPTVRNISSDPNWGSFRAPFIGTKQIWRVFHKAGMFSGELMRQIESYSTSWPEDFAGSVYEYLRNENIYFTNIVKWTGHNADLPKAEKTKLFLPILEREIELVNPSFIITFGLIPFNYLTGEKLKLSDYYSNLVKTNQFQLFEKRIGENSFNVIPCYFPVGRGDPKRAVEMLKRVRELQNF